MWVEWQGGQRAEICARPGISLQGPPSVRLCLLPRYTGHSDRRSIPKPERKMELRGSARNYFEHRIPSSLQTASRRAGVCRGMVECVQLGGLIDLTVQN